MRRAGPAGRAAAAVSSTWVATMLGAAGRRVQGAPETVRAYPWSEVARLGTAGGDVYFKRIALPYSVEPVLLQTLSRWFPGKVPGVIAIEPERRWILMEDAGVPLRRQLKARFEIAPLASALVLMAEIQREAAGRVEALLSLGLADWRLATLPSRYPALVDGAAELDAEERAALQALSSRFEALCAALASFGVPETLEHCDFHDNNVLVRDGRMTVADWGDAVVSHPFLSLASCLDSAGWNHALGDEGARPPIGAYLDVWSAFGSPDRLAKAARLARRIRPILSALNFGRVIAADIGADTLRDVAAERLRAFLHAEAAAPEAPRSL